MGRIGSISAVLPAYDEEANVGAAVQGVLAALDARGWDGEVIVVDDGSRDGTREIAERLAAADLRVRALCHRENRGYGAALRTGIGAARGEHIFFTDADLQFDAGEIGRLEPWIATHDIVVGYRAARRDPWVRRMNAWGWNQLIDRLFHLGVRDVDCAFKLFHRRVFDAVGIQSLGAFVNSEILVRATAAGFRVKEVPVSHHPRRAGTATGGRVRVIGRAWLELGGLYPELREAQRRGKAAGYGPMPIASDCWQVQASSSPPPPGEGDGAAAACGRRAGGSGEAEVFLEEPSVSPHLGYARSADFPRRGKACRSSLGRCQQTA